MGTVVFSSGSEVWIPCRVLFLRKFIFVAMYTWLPTAYHCVSDSSKPALVATESLALT